MNPEDNINSNPDMPNPAPVDTTTTDLPDLDSAAAEVTAAVEEAANNPIETTATPDVAEPTVDAAVDIDSPVDPADPATSVTPEEPPVEEPVNIEPTVVAEQPAAESVADPTQNTVETPAPAVPVKKSSNVVIIILIVALIAVLGAIAYMLFFAQ